VSAIGSIFVEVRGDITKFQQDMTKLRTVAKKGSKEVSDALNNGIMPGKASQSISALSTGLKQLSQSAKIPAENFKATSKEIARALDGVAKEVGMTSKEFTKLNEKMLRNQAMKQAEGAMRKVATAASLSKKEIKALGIQMGYTGKQAKAMANKLDRSKYRMQALGDSIMSTRSKLISLGLAASAAVYTVKELSTAIWDAGRRTLVAENAYKSITGSVAGANVQFEFLRDTAKELGLNFFTLREGYKGFLAAARSSTLPMKEIQKIFRSVSNAGAILGLSNEKMSLTFLALEQMLSKGKISMEEIRRQMGDSLPGAFQLGAKAMGMTVEAFDKAVSAGEVYADVFLPKFSKAMDETYIGTIADSVKAVNLLSETWEELKVKMSNNGFMDDVADAILAFSDELKDPEFIIATQAFAKNLGSIVELSGTLAAFSMDRIVAFTNFFKGIGFASEGKINFTDWITANPEEMAAMVSTLREIEVAGRRTDAALREGTAVTQEDLRISIKATIASYDSLKEKQEDFLSSVRKWKNGEPILFSNVVENDEMTASLKGYTGKLGELKQLLIEVQQVAAWTALGFKEINQDLDYGSDTSLSNYISHWQKLKGEFETSSTSKADKFNKEMLGSIKETDAERLKSLKENLKLWEEGNNTDVRIRDEALKQIASLEKKSADAQIRIEKNRAAAIEKSYKDLLKKNLGFAKAEIDQGERMQDDMWLIRQKGLDKAIKQHEETQTKITNNDYKAYQKRLTDEEKARDKAIKKQEKDYQHMYDNIHDIAADFWEGILDGQMSSWDDFMDHMLNTFKKTFAQILADATTPILLNLVSGVLGGGGSGGGSGILGKIGDKLGTGILNKLSTSPVFGSLFNSVPSGSFALASGVPGSMATAGNAAWSAGIGGGGLSGTLGGGGLSAGASWPSMLTGAAGIGVIAAAGMIATKVLGRMFSEKPQFGISGMSKEAWKFGTGSFDREINPYEIAMENMYDDFKSNLYDYRVFAADFDNEPEMRNVLFDYFDTVFASVDKAMSTNINDVLKDYQHLGVSFRLTEDMDAGQALKGLSKAVFSELVGSMLLGVIPGAGAVGKGVNTIVGSQYITAGSIAAKNAPQPGSREFYDSSAFSPQGKGSGADPYLYTEPVYETITHQVSAMADIFNTAFFEAIMPEGSSTWDSFIAFADIVNKTTDFMDKFNDRVNDLGLSSVEAYQQIAFVSNSLSEMEDAIEALNLDPVAATIKTLVEGFDLLNEALVKNNATAEELTKAHELQEVIFWEEIKNLSAAAVGMVNSMSESVKGIIWSSDQIKMQNIASQGEKIISFFNGVYDSIVSTGNTTFVDGANQLRNGITIIVDTLMAVQGLDLFRGHLQTIGSAKASIYGLENEFAAMGIGSKYGVDLGSGQQQAAFVKSVLGMSATEFITATETFGVSVDEATGDLMILADMVKETSEAFEDIGDTMGDTIKSLEQQFGMSGSSSLTNLIKDFNKAAGDAKSSDSLIAMAGANKLPGLSSQILARALAESPTSYEYKKVYAKIIGTLQDVEDAADGQVDALSITDKTLGEQLTELEGINDSIGFVDESIKALMGDDTFLTYYGLFNKFFGQDSVFGKLDSTLISLAGALGSLNLLPPDPKTNIVTNPVTGQTGPKTVSDPSQWMPWQLDTTGKNIATETEAQIIAKYGISGLSKAQISASLAEWNSSTIFQKADWAEEVGFQPAEIAADINKLTSAYGYAEGGVASGPKSGFPAMLHGTEAIIPMNGANIPLVIKNDYSKGILSVLQSLREDLKAINSTNALKIKKIKQTLDRVTNGGTSFAVTETG
jgi:tape measure domain-containing protein